MMDTSRRSLESDPTRRNPTGQINARLEAAALRIVAQKRLRLTRDMAERFYAVHAERAFFCSEMEIVG